MQPETPTSSIDRRQFLKLLGGAAGATLLSSCRLPETGPGRSGRLLVLAFDGLDPKIVTGLMRAGRLPHFQRVADAGSFKRLATSTPAHTPVAFANIISGADPGTHQIFDFIHRDPRPAEPQLAVKPYFSCSEAVPPRHDWAMHLGRWQLPLVGGRTILLRRGPTFWESLVQHGVDTTVYYIPSNYPPEPVAGSGRFRCISGMGTPDLSGSHGLFTMFTPDAPVRGRTVSGGRFVRLAPVFHRATARLIGPPNPLLRANDPGHDSPMTVEFEIVRDAVAKVARIDVAGQTLLLNEGEWSDWVPIQFQTGLPGSGVLRGLGAPTRVPGMVRFFLKEVHPKLQLYASPINIDPAEPVARISVPDEFAAQLARRHGRFYTAGIPQDTKALSEGAFNEDQFLGQVKLTVNDLTAQYDDALRNFRRGCLFYYFGWPDLVQHMFWRDRDPQHPGYDPRQAERFGTVIDDAYVHLDGLVGRALAALGPDDTLIILSDHGFTSFRRQFNLNTWLAENGYLRLIDPERQDQDALFMNVNWAGSRAYGLGMNGLYLNLWGREKFGMVRSQAGRSLLEEIAGKLLEVRDDNGARVIHRIDPTADRYPAADPAVAPDLIVGYADGYRASWATVLGQMPRRLIEDNLDRWSGDHLIAPDLVPGILLSNRQIAVDDPTVSDIGPTILGVFGIARPAAMTGRPLFNPV